MGIASEKSTGRQSLGVVTAGELELSLQELAGEVEDPLAGIHPADSISWEINREWILFLGGGCALLLQLAHPFVAQAVEGHSQTFHDAWGRFLRTFRNVWAMSFGTLEEALTASRRVHRVHTAVQGRMQETVGSFVAGSPYSANHPQALCWVYATLLETSVRVFEMTVRPLDAQEKEDFYQQSQSFALLFGLRRRDLPADWNGFLGYWEDQLNGPSIRVGASALRVADFLFTPPLWILSPAVSWYRTITAALLPPRLREEFGLPLAPGQQRLFKYSIGTSRRLLPWCPGRLRYLPAYYTARRRVRR